MKTVFSSFYANILRRGYIAWALGLAVALALPIFGLGGEIELQLQNKRAEILDKPASGEVVLVEIDANSIQDLDQWPWPRQYYAKIVDKLSDAGAAKIVFDVDFSSHSTPQQDAAFAKALAQSQASVILPTFKQKGDTKTDAYVESLPIPALRKNAFLASVNVHPDKRGQLNHYSYGTKTGGIPRPSLASMIAEKPGRIDQNFTIDQSINPATIPSYSFVDILTLDQLDQPLKDKTILIGATAIELGDRYPISRFGVVPGVVIQALAAETLIQGTNFIDIGYIPPLALAAFFMLLVINKIPDRSKTIALSAVFIALLLTVMLIMAEKLSVATFSNVPAFFFIGGFVLFEKFFRTNLALRISRFSNSASELPNEAAMEKFIEHHQYGNVATARIVDFLELLALTDQKTRAELFENIADRLKFLAKDEKIFHLDTDIVGWVIRDDYASDISVHFETAIALFNSPVIAGDRKIKLNLSFGVSSGSIDKAKMASEQALKANKRWEWHDEDADSNIWQKQDLLVELDQAIEASNIWVVYQPKWSLSNNRLSGAEALVRWEHPTRGMISPEIFIPLLERAGRIDELTFFVLQQTIRDFSKWNKAAPNLNCSVNISAKLLSNSDFIDKAIALVSKVDFDNSKIIFEVTETAALSDPEQCILALQILRKAGIKISLDDYGTGQSTLSYLQRLPIDELKIDKGFVQTMKTDKANQLMVKSTIELANALGLSVVAEGIEDQSTMDLLKEYSCDIVQGWHISKPVSAEVFESHWLNGIPKRKIA